MNVENYKGNEVDLERTIQDALSSTCGVWIESNTAGDALRAAANNRDALAALLALLVERGVLSLADLTTVIIPTLDVSEKSGDL